MTKVWKSDLCLRHAGKEKGLSCHRSLFGAELNRKPGNTTTQTQQTQIHGERKLGNYWGALVMIFSSHASGRVFCTSGTWKMNRPLLQIWLPEAVANMLVFVVVVHGGSTGGHQQWWRPSHWKRLLESCCYWGLLKQLIGYPEGLRLLWLRKDRELSKTEKLSNYWFIYVLNFTCAMR